MSDTPGNTDRYNDNDLPDNTSPDHLSGPATGETRPTNQLASSPSDQRREPMLSWLWHHIGMISGLIISLLAIASVVFLAVAGFTDALVLLVIVVFGVAMIIVGGRIRSK